MKEYKSNIKRYQLVPEKSEYKKCKITCSSDSYNYIKQFYGSDIEIMESFYILMLNNSNNTLGYVKLSSGGITGTLVDIRLLAKFALDSLACAVILAHNHPSGTLMPSQADKNLTQKIKKGLELLDIKVLDHIILTPGDEYFSFADSSIL